MKQRNLSRWEFLVKTGDAMSHAAAGSLSTIKETGPSYSILKKGKVLDIKNGVELEEYIELTY